MKFSRNRIHSILIFRALALGDMLCAVPAVRALRAAYPDARITLAALPWAKVIRDLFPEYFDEFIPFLGFPGLPEHAPEPEKLPEFFREVQSRRFDLAVQLHGSGRLTNSLVAAMGAKSACGFYEEGFYCPDPKTFFPYPGEGHEIRRSLRLMECLGVPLQGEHLEFPVSEKDRQEFGRDPRTAHLVSGEPYACVHAGSRLPSRRWPAERFAAAAGHLHRRGYRVVLTGSAAERELAEKVSRGLSFPHDNLAGVTGLGTLGALLEGARLLLTNDTGISHVASAVGTPSVVLVMGSDPDRWAPLDRSRHETVLRDIECRPCGHEICPIGHPCAEEISVEEVCGKAEEVLARQAPFYSMRQNIGKGEKRYAASSHPGLALAR